MVMPNLKELFISLPTPTRYLICAIFWSFVTAIWFDIMPTNAFTIVGLIWLVIISFAFLIAILTRVMDNDMKNKKVWS
jgi:hypothetical protein